MTSPEYQDILDLFAQGATAQAEAKFVALRERGQEVRVQRHRDRSGGSAATGQPGQDGTGYTLVENGRKIGLFCQSCFEADGRLERLQARDCTTYFCRVCRASYERKLCG